MATKLQFEMKSKDLHHKIGGDPKQVYAPDVIIGGPETRKPSLEIEEAIRKVSTNGKD